MKRAFLTIISVSLITLSGCQEISFEEDALLLNARQYLPLNKSITKAMEFLKEEQFEEASFYVNAGLQNFGQHPYLHLLNGLIYEKLASLGCDGKLHLAQVAYEKAFSLDPTHPYAVYALGRLRFKNRDYTGAQEYFAQAVLLQPKDPIFLYELGVASYYSYDISSARCAVEALLAQKKLKPEAQRLALMVWGATGEIARASDLMKQIETSGNFSAAEKKTLRRRFEDWKNLHVNKSFMSRVKNYVAPTLPLAVTPKTVKIDPVVVFDCYILRVSDEASGYSGYNLLRNLGFTAPADDKGGNRESISLDGLPDSQSWRDAQGVIRMANPSQWCWQTLSYSLSIANSSEEYVEVLGRPTLSTFLKKPAKFLSGSQILGAVRNDQTNSGEALTIPTGVILEITPLEMENDYVTLEISLQSSMLKRKPSSTSGITQQTLDLQKTEVRTTVKLKFGETGILGGIEERFERKRDTGFPWLRHLPFVGGFFGRNENTHKTRSILFLLTPRQPQDIQKTPQFFSSLAHQQSASIHVKKFLRETTLYDPVMAQLMASQKNLCGTLYGLYSAFKLGDARALCSGSIDPRQELISFTKTLVS